MQTMYLKKIALTEEEKKQLQKEPLYYGRQEETLEKELSTITEHYQSQAKTKKADISTSIIKRREIQGILSNEYKMIEVQCRSFTDQTLRKEYVIEVGNCEVLDVKDLPPYAPLELGFDNYSVVLADREKFIELYNENKEIYSNLPFEIDEENHVFVFRSSETDEMRAIRLSEDFTTDEMVEFILNPPQFEEEEVLAGQEESDGLFN